MRWRIWVTFGCVLIMALSILYYFFVLGVNSSVITLEKKSKSHITVIFSNGEKETIKTSEIITPLIEEGKTYFIKFRYNKWRKPFLVKIEP